MSNYRASGVVAGLLFAAVACSPVSREPQSPEAKLPSPILRLSGEVMLPEGASFEYFAILVRDPSDPDHFLGTIDIPKQALSGESLSSVRLVPGSKVYFELPFPGTPRWVGSYQEDGTLRCQFTQGEHVRDCSMTAVTSHAREHAFEVQ